MIYTPKKILITGGAGMIGSNLVKSLILDENYNKNDIFVVDNLWRGCIENICHYIDIETNFFNFDLYKSNQLDDIIIKHNIDTIIHLADIVAGIGYVTKNEWFLFNQNIVINSNTIKSVKDCSDHIKAFINVSTACCFPKSLQVSLESKLNENQLYPAEPETSYGWSKLMGMYETELLQNNSNILCCNLIFHNVYGSPCDIGERSQVIPSLIKKAINCSVDGELEVWGSGNQGRAFLHVDDVVKSITLAMKKGYNQGCIQIGPDKCTTIKEIAENIVKITEKNIKINYDISKPEGDFGRCADFSKANEILGWSPTVDIESGIKITYDYINTEIEKQRFTHLRI
jgi:nucleoside-diphosphate-sugar epimerase